MTWLGKFQPLYFKEKRSNVYKHRKFGAMMREVPTLAENKTQSSSHFNCQTLQVSYIFSKKLLVTDSATNERECERVSESE
jgi:hypothetical protein